MTWSYVVHHRYKSKVGLSESTFTNMGNATVNPRGVDFAVIEDPIGNVAT
eukprot:UN08998